MPIIFVKFRAKLSCFPIKLRFQDKNDRKTKIPFPFPSSDLQLVETALHYHCRGWGYTSLFERAYAHIQYWSKAPRCWPVIIAGLRNLALLLSRTAQSTVFYRNAQFPKRVPNCVLLLSVLTLPEGLSHPCGRRVCLYALGSAPLGTIAPLRAQGMLLASPPAARPTGTCRRLSMVAHLRALATSRLKSLD